MAVAAIVGKTERLLVDNFNKALRAASVLNIGRAVRGRGGEESGILFCNELCELRRYSIGEAFGNTPFIGFRRATLGLRLARGRREYALELFMG